MIGKQLGHYAVVDQLGRGGMATVYKAFQAGLDRPVALKILQPALAADDVIVKRFQQEARIAANLYHPSIVTIYDVGELEGLYYIAMRFIDGENLGQFLRREGPLQPDRAFEMLGQVAEALDFAHSRGILHRDVKPGNVLVEDGRRLTLTDFGIARASERAQLTATRMVIGTPEYMSPEQARGDPVDRRADLYAFGVMLYETLGGRPPFSAASTPSLLYLHVHEAPPPLEQLRPDLPPTLGAVLAKSLAKAPDQRYGSAGEMLDAARQAVRGWAPPAGGTTLPTLVAAPDDDGRETPPRPFPPTGPRRSDPGVAGRATDSRAPARTLTPPPAPVRPADPSVATRPTGGAPMPARATHETRAGTPRPGAWLIGPAIAAVALLLVGGVIAYQSGMVPGLRPATPTAVPSKPTVAAATVAPTTVAQPVAPPTAVPATAAPTAAPPTPAPPTAAPLTPTPDPAQRLEVARAALAAKDFPGALQILDELRKTDPSLNALAANARIDYANALLEEGKLDEADAQLGAAIATEPLQAVPAQAVQQKISLARHWRTMEASWGTDEDAAMGALESIMQIDSNYRDARQKLYSLLVGRADRLLSGGDRDGAYPALMRALELVPDGPEARQRLASYTPTATPVPAPPPQQPAPAPKVQPAPAPKVQPAPAPAPPRPAPQPAPQPQPAPPQDRGRPV